MAMDLSEDEWKRRLTPEQYRVLRQKGTEYPGTGELLHNTRAGEYRCAACGQLLFKSDAKYESNQLGLEGWPSFADPADSDAVELKPDNSLDMARTEVVCKNCGSHLGHLFNDPSSPSGQHYCVSSVCLKFDENSAA
jgi:peptide-methionine (R)-S-oxide reductase